MLSYGRTTTKSKLSTDTKCTNALQIVLVMYEGMVGDEGFFYSQTMSSFLVSCGVYKAIGNSELHARLTYSLCNAILEPEFRSIYLTWADCP